MTATSVATPGQILTFYSYKGGVGRSMAVANVAVRLAQRGKKVLVMDFDLEAPGLHRYFPRTTEPEASTAQKGGVIELFGQLRSTLDGVARSRSSDKVGFPWAPDGAREAVAALLDGGKFTWAARVYDPNRGVEVQLRVMRAGLFNAEYPETVRAFSFRDFFEKHPYAIELLADELSRRYDFVLIDSRTGTTDVGNMCTVLLPEKLVLVFTPNEQSLHGAVEMGRQAVELRKESPDVRPLPLFPLVSRVENAETTLQKQWITEAKKRFESTFRQVYDSSKPLEIYFDAIQIPHRSFYAYGESIACELERVTEANSMAACFDQLVTALQGNNAVDAQQDLAARFGSPPSEAQEAAAKFLVANRELSTRAEEAERRENALKVQISTQISTRRSWYPWIWGGAAAFATALAAALLAVRHPATFAECIASKLPDDKSLWQAFASGTVVSAAAVPILTDPVKRSQADACAKATFGMATVAWTVSLPVLVTNGSSAAAGHQVRCGAATCLTDSTGKCHVLVPLPSDGGITCDVQVGGAEPVTATFATSHLPDPLVIHLEAVDAVAPQDADDASVAARAAEPSVSPEALRLAHAVAISPKALALARAVANMVETRTPDQNYFVWAMSAGRTALSVESGSYQILTRYVAQKGPQSDLVAPFLARAGRNDRTLVTDPAMRRMLTALTSDPLVIQIAQTYLDEGWWAPSVLRAAGLGIDSALGISIVFDVYLHGVGTEEKAVTQVTALFDGKTPATGADEKGWVAGLAKSLLPVQRQEYERLISDGNWDLTKPISIYGQPLVVSWLPTHL